MKKSQTSSLNVPSMKHLALSIVNFSKKYRGRNDYAVEKASFSVRPGQFHGFIGANGAGKTTTIKSLIGAYAKYEGDIQIFGEKNTSKKGKKRLGYIPENANFPKNLNAFEYVAHMAEISGMKYRDARKYAQQVLIQMGLGPIMYKKPTTFSSGQKKKVLLAQALVNNPDVIIMDEPAANLDPRARHDFFELLKNLQNQGKAILISSHILAEINNYIDSVTILDGGKIVYSGTKEELLKSEPYAFNIAFEEEQNWLDFSKWLNKETITYQTSALVEKAHVCYFKTEAKKIAALKYIINNKLKMTIFHEDRKTLQQAYDHYVNFGSRDTSQNWSQQKQFSSNSNLGTNSYQNDIRNQKGGHNV